MNPELITQLRDLLGLSDEDIAELSHEDAEGLLRDAFTEARTQDDGTDEHFARLAALTDAVEAVRADRQAVEEAQAARQAEIDELAARMEQAEPDEEAPAEEATPAEDGEEATEAPAEEPSASPETEAETPAEEPEPVAVAAAAEEPAPAPAPQRRALAARPRPPANDPARRARQAPFAITAAGDVQGYSAGQPMKTLGDLQHSIREKAIAFGDRETPRTPVGSVNWSKAYDERHTLTMDEDANEAKIREVLADREAILASGGSCAPTAASYDLVTISSAARPVRDALPQFAATRGGIRFVPPLKLSDITADTAGGAVTTWTRSTDTTPGGSTKTCETIICNAAQEVTTDAISYCAKIGNFISRTFPEQQSQFLDLIMARHARVAEAKLVTAIGTASTAITAGHIIGAMRDFLETLDRIYVNYTSSERMDYNTPLVLVAPYWLRNLLRADVTRQLPGDDELGMTLDEVDALIRARGFQPVWTLADTQVYSAQAVGGLNAWRTSVVYYVFHQGAFLFLDGGNLDLGVVRDSTLNSTNDFNVWGETFENIAYRGVKSWKITQTLCPTGQTAATVDTSTLCTSGS